MQGGTFGVMTIDDKGNFIQRCGVASFTHACKIAQEVSKALNDTVIVRNLDMGTNLMRYRGGEEFPLTDFYFRPGHNAESELH